MSLEATKLIQAGATVRMTAWHPFIRQSYNVSNYFTMSKEQWKSSWHSKLKREARERRRVLRNVGDPELMGLLGGNIAEISMFEDSDDSTFDNLLVLENGDDDGAASLLGGSS